jgi:hypothetical protein
LSQPATASPFADPHGGFIGDGSHLRSGWPNDAATGGQYQAAFFYYLRSI